MSDIKKALQKKIGNTDEQKVRVWEKLNRKQKKHFMPYFVSAVFLVCMVILTISLLDGKIGGEPVQEANPDPTNHTGTLSSSITNNQSTEVPILSAQTIEAMRISYSESYAVHLYTSLESYEQMASIYNVEMEPIDFAKNDVLFTQFISNGCGLVVDRLSVKDKQLIVTLELPEDLRSEKELMCTEIAITNTVLLVVPKLDVDQAVMINRTNEYETRFQVINSVSTNTNTLMTDDNIIEMEFIHPSDELKFIVNEPSDIQLFKSIFSQGLKVQGIADMSSPDWSIYMKNEAGETKHYSLWLDPYEMSATIMDNAETHTVYTISEIGAIQLFNLIQIHSSK